MTNEKILAIAIIVTIVLYPFYFIFIRKRRKAVNEKDKAAIVKKNGLSTTAILKKSRYHPGDLGESTAALREGFYTTTYEYIVDGAVYKKKFCIVGNGSESPEHEITMYYLPDAPKKAFTEDQVMYRADRQIGCVSVIVIPVVWMILLFYILKFLVFLC